MQDVRILQEKKEEIKKKTKNQNTENKANRTFCIKRREKAPILEKV